MQKALLRVLIAAWMFSPCLSDRAESAEAPIVALSSPIAIGPYEFSIEGDAGTISPDARTAVIRRDGQEIWSTNAAWFAVHRLPRPDDSPPTLIVTDFSGGAHCCLTLHILQFGLELRHQSIWVGHSDVVDFLDNASLPAIGFDYPPLAYWRAGFALSTSVRLVLRFDPVGGQYQADGAATRRPPPTPADLQALVTDIQADHSNSLGGVSPRLWGEMLHLIYSGNAGQARQLADLAWPPGNTGLACFIQDFTRTLYATDLWQQFDLGRVFNTEDAFPLRPRLACPTPKKRGPSVE